MKVVTGSRLSSFSSAIFYMLSPQVLYGRFFIGHFTHNFSMFFIPLTLFVIVKSKDNIKKTALITAPLFSLLFLSHLQTALSLGFMLGIYIFFSLISRWRKEKFDEANISGLFIGGVLGLSLSSFWLLTALFEGSGKLVSTNEAALKVMFPIQNFFVESGNPWHKQYFLGFPLIIMALLSIGLILGRRLLGKKKLWGILFASWTAFFLFTTVSPSIGLVFGWPNRFAHFVSMPMAMLAGLSVNWIENNYPASFRQSSNLKRVARYLLLTVVILSTLVHTLNVEQFAFKPYTNEIEATEWLDSQAIRPGERVAAFGTFSYVFNTLSDGWQLDGGYLQGQINLDFYYQYWQTLMTSDNADEIFTTFVHTNTRYVVFPQASEMPSAYLNQTLFDRNDMYGFAIFKLKDNITLNLVEGTHDNASVSYSYLNPDELHLSVRNCSESITLNVKMNYYPGWTIRSSANNVVLTKDVTGLIKIEIEEVDDLDITLKYDSIILDHIALGATIGGVVIYLLLLVSFFRRSGARIRFTQKCELEGVIRAANSEGQNDDSSELVKK
jgi:hypothetical protein